QPVPDYDEQKDIMTIEEFDGGITMVQVRKLLRLRLQLAKDSLHMHMPPRDGTQQDEVLAHVALPTHALLCTCESCGVAYAQDVWRDPEDADDGRYCRVCIGKRKGYRVVKNELRDAGK